MTWGASFELVQKIAHDHWATCRLEHLRDLDLVTAFISRCQTGKKYGFSSSLRYSYFVPVQFQFNGSNNRSSLPSGSDHQASLWTCFTPCAIYAEKSGRKILGDHVSIASHVHCTTAFLAFFFSGFSHCMFLLAVLLCSRYLHWRYEWDLVQNGNVTWEI